MLIPDISQVKRMRTALGITQARLARQSGVSQSIIAKIERNRCDPSYSTLRKLFEFFEGSMKSEGATAEKIMSREIVSVGQKDRVSKAIMLMQKRSFSALPVIEDGRAVGHVSDDTIMRHLAEGREVGAKTCGQIMDEPFPRVGGASPVSAIGELLRYSKAVLVTRGEKVVGIITKADLLKLIKP